MRNVIILVKAKDNLLLKLCQDKKLDLSYRDILDLELVLVQHKLQVLPHKLVPKTTLFQIREQWLTKQRLVRPSTNARDLSRAAPLETIITVYKVKSNWNKLTPSNPKKIVLTKMPVRLKVRPSKENILVVQLVRSRCHATMPSKQEILVHADLLEKFE